MMMVCQECKIIDIAARTSEGCVQEKVFRKRKGEGEGEL